MTKHSLLGIGALTIGLLSANVERAGAACYGGCTLCSVERWKPIGPGTQYAAGGCHPVINCPSCISSSYSENRRVVAELVAAIKAGSAADLEALVKKYRSRLVVHRQRNLLAVVAVGCEKNTIQSVLFLPTAKATTLAALGIQPMDEFLRQGVGLAASNGPASKLAGP